MAGRLYKNVHRFYLYYHCLTVNASGVGAAPVTGTHQQ